MIKRVLFAVGLGAAVVAAPFVKKTPEAPKQETVLILRGLSHYAPSGWPAVELKEALEKQGYKVKIGNHTDGDNLSSLPDILIGHSMGGNAVLKAANRVGKGPRLVLALDPGKRPLWRRCPDYARCVNLYGPRLFIAGETVTGKRAENYLIQGTQHGTFPQYPKVINAVVRIVNEGKPK